MIDVDVWAVKQYEKWQWNNYHLWITIFTTMLVTTNINKPPSSIAPKINKHAYKYSIETSLRDGELKSIITY